MIQVNVTVNVQQILGAIIVIVVIVTLGDILLSFIILIYKVRLAPSISQCTLCVCVVNA